MAAKSGKEQEELARVLQLALTLMATEDENAESVEETVPPEFEDFRDYLKSINVKPLPKKGEDIFIWLYEDGNGDIKKNLDAGYIYEGMSETVSKPTIYNYIKKIKAGNLDHIIEHYEAYKKTSE